MMPGSLNNKATQKKGDAIPRLTRSLSTVPKFKTEKNKTPQILFCTMFIGN